ncbi:MAG: LexA family transcriptional regulator [Chloroflexi bacterium]|nr:LexA family transcriptional regulator [Chloroflexota bacterium]
MTHPYMTFANRLRSERLARGWSQGELGERLGKFLAWPLDQTTISNLERDIRPPTAPEVIAISRALDRRVGWLLGEPDEAPEPSLHDLAAQLTARLAASDTQEAHEELAGDPAQPQGLIEIAIVDQQPGAGFRAGSVGFGSGYWSIAEVAGRVIRGAHVISDTVRGEVRPGDTIFVDTEMTDPGAGDLVVATYDDGFHVCRVTRKGGRFWCVNQEAQIPIESVVIEGVVVRLSRDLNQVSFAKNNIAERHIITTGPPVKT